MLRVVLERVVGDTKLPAGVRVVAAANPPDEAADGWELAAPLANRLVHLDWPIEGKTYRQRAGGRFPATGCWPGSRTRRAPRRRWLPEPRSAHSLRFVPPLALQLPRIAADAGRGWPSPRSWEAVAKLLAACEAADASEAARAALVEGAVGDGAAIEFLAWLEHLDLPDPEAVLADPDGFVSARAQRPRIRGADCRRISRGRGRQPTSAGSRRGELSLARPTAPRMSRLGRRTLATHRPPGAEVPEALMELAPVLRAAGLLRSPARCGSCGLTICRRIRAGGWRPAGLGGARGAISGERTVGARSGGDRPSPEDGRSTCGHSPPIAAGTCISIPKCSQRVEVSELGFWMLHQVSHLLREHAARYPGRPPPSREDVGTAWVAYCRAAPLARCRRRRDQR